MDPDKAVYAQATGQRTLAEAIDGADVFLGLSAGGVLKPEMVARMAARPLVLRWPAVMPEITPEEVMKVRNDAIMATGRTDYPNQVNNVLCFPYIFRGALDCGATSITNSMLRPFTPSPIWRRRSKMKKWRPLMPDSTWLLVRNT